MEEIIMSNIQITNLDWDSFIIPDDLSAKEEEIHSKILSEYLSRRTVHTSSELPSYEKVTKINIDNSFIEKEEVEFDQITNDELFEYILAENIEVNPDYLFPKTSNIERVFWFLHHLSQEDISASKIQIENIDDLSVIFHETVENALFLGFLERVEEEGIIYLIPRSELEDFMTKDLENQYHVFLASLGRNETISEAMRLQLNDPIFDSISRQMLHNILVNDANIKQEGLSKDDITKIVNNMRYWYLSVKKAILMN